MVFSMNSRCALQKAQWIPPTSYILTYLRVNERNLSTKTPERDTSKSPLRLSLARDSSNVGPYSKLIRSAQPRSKSLIATPKKSFPSGIDDGLLSKSGSEMHFSSFRHPNDVENNPNKEKMSPDREKESRTEYPEGSSDQAYYFVDRFYSTKSESDANKEVSNLGAQSFNEIFTEDARKEGRDVENRGNPENDDSKNVYVVIDAPEKEREKEFAYVDTQKPDDGFKLKLPSFVQDDFAAVKSLSGKSPNLKTPSIKMKKSSSDGLKSKESQTKLLPPGKLEKGKINSKLKFEVYEIDDPSTYAFQLKFKKGLQGKVSAVGCVPEKEVNTRKTDPTSPDAPVNFCTGYECKGKSLRDVSHVEESLQTAKFTNPKTKRRNKGEAVEEDKSPRGNTMNSVRNFHNSSGCYQDENQISTGGQSFYVFGKDSNSQNVGVGEISHVQVENEWDKPDLEFHNAVEETSGNINCSTLGEGSSSSANTQNSKLSQPDHESSTVYMTYSTSQNSENSPHTIPEVKTQQTQAGFGTVVEDPTIPKKEGKILKLPNKSRPDKRPPNELAMEASEPESTDFKPVENVIKIQSEKPPASHKYSAGLPKIITKSFKNQRKGFGMIDRESVFGRKCCHKSDIDNEKSSTDLFGNHVYFARELDQRKEDSPKMTDNMVNVANEDLTKDKGRTPVDTLTMMKQLKEIVDFDLSNAVKIFEGREGQARVAFKTSEKTKPTNKTSAETVRKNQKRDEMETSKTDQSKISLDGPKEINSEPLVTPKYFPGLKENEGMMKLDRKSDSVVDFNSKTKKFAINMKELETAIRRSRQNFRESYQRGVCQGLEEALSKDNEIQSATSPTHYEAKTGDSILIFDEDSQTWKVDFSILERRRQRIKDEEELTKRSELILERFEKMEREKVSAVQRPSTRDRKTFDYNKEEWKVYRSDKDRPYQKTTRSKSPFKESDAEEIRKRNSDLYENLFVANKRDSKMNKDVKDVEAGNPNKTGKLADGKREGKMLADTKTPDDISSIVPCKINKEDPNKRSEGETDTGDKEKGANPEKGDKGKGGKAEEEEGWASYIKEDIPPLSSVPKLTPSKSGKTPPKKIDPIPVKIPLVPDVSKTPPPKISPPGKTGVKIEEPKFRIPLPFGRKKKIDEPKTKPVKTDKAKVKEIIEPKEKIPPLTGTGPAKPEGDSKIKVNPTSHSNPIPAPEPPKGIDPKSKPIPPSATPKDGDPTAPPAAAPKGADPPPFGSAPPTAPAPPKATDPKIPPTSMSVPPADPKVSPSVTPSGIVEDPKSKIPPSSASSNKEHYVSEKIVEMSKYVAKENSTNKLKQVETVKLNINPNTRIPSKITEINLNKKSDEKTKESSADSNSNPNDTRNSNKNDKCSIENKTFYRNFEKYKSQFSDPDYEDKPVKINSDMESNPNLKKLDNWNKTLVLHDTTKPSENVESWLKDETDKMATLLLKVLQEAADGKPKKKPVPLKGKQVDKTPAKANPYDNIRKKQETTPEGFLFKVRSVNFSLGSDLKTKTSKQTNTDKKPQEENTKDIPIQSAKTAKPAKVVDFPKSPGASASDTLTGGHLFTMKPNKVPHSYSDLLVKEPKSKLPDISLDDMNSPWVGRDLESKMPVEISDDIPGPEILKKISGTWKMFPVIGCQATIFTLLRIYQLVNLGSALWNPAHVSKPGRNAFSNLFSKYGPIVNLQGPLSGNIVLLHKPEHVNGVFEQDTGFSVRSIFDSLEQSRREIEGKILSVGVSTDWNKMGWQDLKKASNDPLVRGCEKFFRPVEVAGESLINNMRRNRNNQNLVSDDFMKEIKQWSMEGLCSVLFEKSFGFLEGRSYNASWLLEPDKFFEVVEEATECLSKCERGFQAWRLVATPSSISLSHAYRALYKILSKHLYQAELNLKNKNELLKDNSFVGSHDLTFLESMILNDGMTIDDVICNIVDLMIVGVNTMSSALGFMLYNLAQNVKVQSKLLKEVKETLPDKTSRLDYHKLHSLKYLQACLKESLRLNPPVPVFFRVLQNDVLISNYVVPKETYVVMDFKLSNMKEQIFEDPEKFMPERWLREDKWLQDVNPISSLPFCHGPRADLAKRVVEMQLWSCLAKIVRNFQIEYHYGEIQGTENVFSYPDKPLKFSFVERDE